MGQRYESKKKSVSENREAAETNAENREILKKEYAFMSELTSMISELEDESAGAVMAVASEGEQKQSELQKVYEQIEEQKEELSENITDEIDKIKGGLKKLEQLDDFGYGKKALHDAKKEYTDLMSKYKELIDELGDDYSVESSDGVSGISDIGGADSFKEGENIENKNESPMNLYGNAQSNPLFGNGEFVPLLITNQTSQTEEYQGRLVDVFDHPFDANTTRICNQGSAYPTGPQGTCGCCACGTIINKAGGNTNEHETVAYAWNNKLCSDSGGTGPQSWVGILGGAGIGASDTTGLSLKTLAEKVEQGYGVIVGVSACTYASDKYGHYFPGRADGHALVIESIVRDHSSGKIIEYIVSDSNGKSADDACHRVPAKIMEKAYKRKHRASVVTDEVIW